MSTREKAFNQVKAILGKIDRSIDEARAKRLGHDRGPKDDQQATDRPLRAKPIRREHANGSPTAWGAA
jgi:hypothetical protein